MKIINLIIIFACIGIITCQGFCFSGQYWSSFLQMCENCGTNCKSCTGEDECTTCDSGFIKGKWGSCECGNGTYLNSTSSVNLK